MELQKHGHEDGDDSIQHIGYLNEGVMIEQDRLLLCSGAVLDIIVLIECPLD